MDLSQDNAHSTGPDRNGMEPRVNGTPLGGTPLDRPATQATPPDGLDRNPDQTGPARDGVTAVYVWQRRAGQTIEGTVRGWERRPLARRKAEVLFGLTLALGVIGGSLAYTLTQWPASPPASATALPTPKLSQLGNRYRHGPVTADSTLRRQYLQERYRIIGPQSISNSQKTGR